MFTPKKQTNPKCVGYSLPYLKPYQYRRNEQIMMQQTQDYGPYPLILNIHQAAKDNTNFRTALWTGDHLQVTLMHLNPGEEIGLEKHDYLDQLIHIVQGRGLVKIGDRPDTPDMQQDVSNNYTFTIPAGKWHNLVNTGNMPLKLFSVYAPPQHPYGTVHVTKADADAAEMNQHS